MTPPPRFFTIFGERNSGTNFIEKLISRNFEDFTASPSYFGWKHGGIDRRWWRPNSIPRTLNDHAREAEDVVFIVIFRNPFDWLVSMHRNPHHAPFHMNLHFSVFLRMEWHEFYNFYGPGDDVKTEPEERFAIANSLNKIEKFPTIFELRREKIERFLQYGSWSLPIIYTNYENIVNNEENFISALAKLIDIKPNPSVTLVEEGKFGGGKFFPRASSPIACYDVEHIVSQLYWFHEHRIGYDIDFEVLQRRLDEAGPAGKVSLEGLVTCKPRIRLMQNRIAAEIAVSR